MTHSDKKNNLSSTDPQINMRVKQQWPVDAAVAPKHISAVVMGSKPCLTPHVKTSLSPKCLSVSQSLCKARTASNQSLGMLSMSSQECYPISWEWYPCPAGNGFPVSKGVLSLSTTTSYTMSSKRTNQGRGERTAANQMKWWVRSSFSGRCLNLMEPSAPQEKRWRVLLTATWVTPDVDPTVRKNVFLLCSPGKE